MLGSLGTGRMSLGLENKNIKNERRGGGGGCFSTVLTGGRFDMATEGF